EKITQIRQVMPVTRQKVYLNTGVCGPLSTVLDEVLRQSQAAELAEGRASVAGFQMLRQARDDLRAALARLVKADPSQIALTHHTTEGMNIISHGLNWQPGDEIVTTDLEHPGGLLPLYVLRQRRGVAVHVVPLTADDSPEAIVARLETAITPRTRLLAWSHVAWNLGARLPLAEIVAMAHRRHVLTLVDGAQSMGAIPLDLPASGVDFYAFPGQKWLCGPEGLGGLYVRSERLSLVWPTFAGYATIAGPGKYDAAGSFMPAAGAARFEVGTVNRPMLQAMVANLAWLGETIGWDWIHARIAHLSGYAHAALSALAGVRVITPAAARAGLITFSLEGYDPARVMIRLAEEGLILRYIDHPYALRISTGFYNTEADIDRLVAALQAIQDSDPESLPVFVGF
ncbi:MAG: aminotransferase class V-fold PLP-dependent enzyme, partial [Chloroflexota bacterium]